MKLTPNTRRALAHRLADLKAADPSHRSYKRIAESTGLSVATVKRLFMVDGIERPTLEALASMYGVTVADLVEVKL